MNVRHWLDKYHKDYYGCKYGYIPNAVVNTVFKDIEEYCEESGIEVKRYIEAQLSALSEFFKKKKLKRFPINSLKISSASVERYNNFLDVNKRLTGSIGVSKNDVLSVDTDMNKEALFEYVNEYIKSGNALKAMQIAKKVYPEFKLITDKEVAVKILYRWLPQAVPYVYFVKGWDWKSLKDFIKGLSL